MKRKLPAMLMALTLLTAVAFPAVMEGASPISNVKAVPYSATQVKVSWDGPGGGAYQVRFGLAKGDFYYYNTFYEDSGLISLAPDTAYWITVAMEDGTGETEPVYITTPRLSNKRDHGYRYQAFDVYYTNANTNLDFWDDDSRQKTDRIQGSWLAAAGETRNYYAVVDFTLSGTQADKEFNWVLVMYAPGARDYYMDWDTVMVTGRWTYASYYFNLNYILQTYLDYNDSFKPGRYEFELYINGWLGGRTSLVVE